ncbi:CHAP domain-containing protein [Enterococcus casseliflavus]|nr:CHAP domain-containing protein [Enterococcus casseliflavus]MBF0015422.1 CHAP domain-containing protein [Enterococcus casseliflavus]
MNIKERNRYSQKTKTYKHVKYRNFYLNRQQDVVSHNPSCIGHSISPQKSKIYKFSPNGTCLKRKRILQSEKSVRLKKSFREQRKLYHPQNRDRLNEYKGYIGYENSQVGKNSGVTKVNRDKESTIFLQRRYDTKKLFFKKKQNEKYTRYKKSSSHKKVKINKGNLNKYRKLGALARNKVDKSLKKNITSKNIFRNKIKEMMIDSIGRDENGELNFVGVILSILLLLPVLFVLIKIVLIASVVIAVISVFVAIWTFIVSLFTIKTEDMALEEAYRYVTYLDAQKNKEIKDTYSQLRIDEENHEVYLILNGVRSNPNSFLFNSNGDTYLYFLNAKYEDYNIDKSSKSSKYSKIRDEVKGIHNYTFNWEIEFEEQEIEKIILEEDEETGEIKEKKQIEIEKIAVIRATWVTIEDYLAEFPEEMNEEERDKFIPIQDLDRFENKIELENPLGINNYATVIEKYGYRDRDTDTRNNEIILSASLGDPVYATTNETVVSVSGDSVTTNAPFDKKIQYINLKNIKVKSGQKLSTGQQIGETTGNLAIRVIERRGIFHSDAILYPAAYINNLIFSYPENKGFHDSGGGLTGDLINPPESVLQWRDLVVKACERNNIVGFENIILAIIWEESGGNPITLGKDKDDNQSISMDIMQSSESLGLPPNSLKTAEESINAGVAYFAEGLRLVEDNNLDKRTAIQAYNFGHGFIQWVVDAGVDYSFDIARLFAREKSKGRTVLYQNPIARNMGFNWRYDYGNMFYVELITQHIMINTGELVKIAKEEIGYPNGDKYWRWFGLTSRVEWCAIFVSWVADQAGYLEQDRILKSASCIELVRWFKDRNQYRLPSDSYIPKEGDLIFFDWNGNRTGKDHVGIVEYSDGKIVQTIEGNSGNAVRRQTYVLDSSVISGYGITRSDNLE